MAPKNPKPGIARNRKGQSAVDDARPGLAARKAAARLLAAIIDKHTSADGLTDDRHGHPQYLALESNDRALVRAILMTALRFRVTLLNIVAERLDRPLPANAHTLNHIMHVALAQMLFLDVPDRAAVDLAVAHANSDPRTKRFGGLVNGVLRAVSRRKEVFLPKTLQNTIDAPEWFIDRLKQAYGDGKAKAILDAHRRLAPVDITVKRDTQQWAQQLGGVVTPTGSVRLAKLEASVTELPGYGEGAWWVQDAAAALPAQLLGIVDGLEVGDLCAAPGGKTAQLAMAGAKVTAIDISENRLKRLAQNFERLQLSAELVAADISAYSPNRLFDAVLLDAPCSSTGTIRRHPDIAWTKTADDVAKLAEVQFGLLTKAIKLIKPGGILVFSNCSLDPLEGELLIERFLDKTEEAKLSPIRNREIAGTGSWITPQGTLRTTPADMDLGRPEISGMDGFFAARFQRFVR